MISIDKDYLMDILNMTSPKLKSLAKKENIKLSIICPQTKKRRSLNKRELQVSLLKHKGGTDCTISSEYLNDILTMPVNNLRKLVNGKTNLPKIKAQFLLITNQTAKHISSLNLKEFDKRSYSITKNFLSEITSELYELSIISIIQGYFEEMVYSEVIDFYVTGNNQNKNMLSKHSGLSVKFISKNDEYLNWPTILRLHKLPESLIESHIAKNSPHDNYRFWNTMSEHQVLSEGFIDRYNDKMDWEIISICQVLSMPFIAKYQNLVVWRHISRYQKLCESFIEQYCDKVEWDVIFIDQNLSESFIDKHKHRVDWRSVSSYRYLPGEFIDRHIHRVDWSNLSKCHLLYETLCDKYPLLVNWNVISVYHILSEKFMTKHQKKVNWKLICEFQTLSEKFITKHSNRVDWKAISEHQTLSEKFMIEHSDQIDWDIVSGHQVLSEEFMIEHINKLNLKTILECQQFSEDFICSVNAITK